MQDEVDLSKLYTGPKNKAKQNKKVHKLRDNQDEDAGLSLIKVLGIQHTIRKLSF